MALFWSHKHHQTSKKRPQTLQILHIEIVVSYTYIWERWITTRSFFSNPLIPIQGCQGPESLPAAQGSRQEPTLDRMPVHHRRYPHSVRRDNGDTPVHITCAASGCGRKPEDLEKTHADMGRICKPHTDGGSAGNQFFFFHNKMTLNEITLFKDLLYTVQESDCIFSGGLLAT